MTARPRAVSRLDLWLLLMVVIWGANFSVIKVALRDMPEVAFNAVRLTVASFMFLALLLKRGDLPAIARLTRSDQMRIALLGLVGHCLYQVCFLAGVARTSVANSSLIFGCTPVAVAVIASVAGQERVRRAGWAGVMLSLAGIYAIVSDRATWMTTTAIGDALVFGGMICWSLYSVLAQPLLVRLSPLVVTGASMMMGSVMYVGLAVRPLLSTRWSAISGTSWALTIGSAVFALGVAYLIWYTAIQRIGSARTALYSNLTPIVAMGIAAIWIGERIGPVQLLGAMLIIGGIAVARLPARVVRSADTP